MFKTEKIIAKSKQGAERRQETKQSGEIEEAIARTKRSIHSQEYNSGDNQELRFEYEDLQVCIKYSEVSSENTTDIQLARAKLEKELPKDNPALKSENWKKLDQFLVQMPDGSVQDVLESVPPEYPIYFCPVNRDSNPKGFIYAEPIQAIFYAGDIGTIAGISVLAHEIGHLHNEYLLPTEERIGASFHRDQDMATVILKERYANAFALKRLRKFITSVQERKDVHMLLRNYGQGSYDHLLTQVNQARTNAEEAMFYAELQRIMDQDEYDYGHGIFGLGDEDWGDDKNVGI